MSDFGSPKQHRLKNKTKKSCKRKRKSEPHNANHF
uniref:Uncharacterized protein n=1 Tax=Anguilla anguilla TaxID=7936 RepID=A0A0E9TRI0_ANGAN